MYAGHAPSQATRPTCGRHGEIGGENHRSRGDCRELLGEYASVSAAAACLAWSFKKRGAFPDVCGKRETLLPEEKGVLVLGFGKYLTAMEVI